MGDQKPKALNETLEILLQQVGKQTVKPEGQLQTKVSLSFRFLHKKLCPGLKGVMGRGEGVTLSVWAGPSPPTLAGRALSSLDHQSPSL